MTIGDVPAALVTVTDLTVQRRAEEIAVAERFARSILEQVTDPIVVLDIDGQILRASAAAEELCDLPPYGRSFSEVFHLQTADPNHLPLLPSVSPSEFDTMLATRAFHGVEVQLDDSKTAGRTFLLSAGPLLDDTKCPVGSIVTLTDITSRKHAEELQSLMVAELNHRVKNTLGTDSSSFQRVHAQVQFIRRSTISVLAVCCPALFFASRYAHGDALERG